MSESASWNDTTHDLLKKIVNNQAGGTMSVQFGAAGLAVAQAATDKALLESVQITSYTVAQLNALTAAQRPPIAYCSDALTTDGTGSPVIWNGSKWICTCSNIEATTDLLTFFRGVRDAGIQCFAKKTTSVRMGRFPYGPGQTASGSGAGTNIENDGETQKSDTGTTTTGYIADASYGDIARVPTGAGTGLELSAAYHATKVYFSNLSTVAEEYSYRVGFTHPSAASLLASEVFLGIDRGNVLGVGNTGNSPNWIAVARASSTNSVTITGVSPSTTSSTAHEAEVLLLNGVARFYINGNIVADTASNVPTDPVYPRFIMAKSAGTTSRTVYQSKRFVIKRFA